MKWSVTNLTTRTKILELGCVVLLGWVTTLPTRIVGWSKKISEQDYMHPTNKGEEGKEQRGGKP